MLAQIKHKLFGIVQPIDSIVNDELYEAEVALLEAQSGVEWAKANVEYQSNRVARLKKYKETKQLEDNARAYTPKVVTK
jgi:hypothetical protein